MKDKRHHSIEAKIWLYQGYAGWHFITIPQKTSKEIKDFFGDLSGGWGSLPVMVTIGKMKWKTSIFPDKKSRAYLLPLKAEVRKKENIGAGDVVAFSMEILV